MSWASVVNKKNLSTEKKPLKIKEKRVNIIEDNCKETLKENFENKHDLDLFDFCFDLKDYMNNSSDILSNIDSYKIGNFIKEHIDYSKYITVYYDDSDNNNSDTDN